MASLTREDRVFACAMDKEEKVAQGHGQTLVVGISCSLFIPTVPVVSFGIAGALGDLPLKTVVDPIKVVDENGVVLWEGKPLGIKGAFNGVVLGTNRFINTVEERKRLRARTGADVVDMESGIFARNGVLAGCIRAVSDTPLQQLGSPVISPWLVHQALKALRQIRF